MLVVKKHPSRPNTYVDAVAAVHPALKNEPWLYFDEGEYTRTFEGLVVPLKPQTKPRLLHRPMYPNDPTTTASTKGNN
nr:MAG TPA: hypothetical protein [Caudoviricetes sp.]